MKKTFEDNALSVIKTRHLKILSFGKTFIKGGINLFVRIDNDCIFYKTFKGEDVIEGEPLLSCKLLLIDTVDIELSLSGGKTDSYNMILNGGIDMILKSLPFESLDQANEWKDGIFNILSPSKVSESSLKIAEKISALQLGVTRTSMAAMSNSRLINLTLFGNIAQENPIEPPLANVA